MAVPVCQCTQSVVPPLETMRPRLPGRSRSGTSRPRSSPARAAVSYSIRHSVLSRSGASSRQIAATCARVSALVVSTGTFGRAHPAVGSAATQPASAHQASAERSADRCRARVAGASPPNAAVNAACRLDDALDKNISPICNVHAGRRPELYRRIAGKPRPTPAQGRLTPARRGPAGKPADARMMTCRGRRPRKS
jgi:hypothetical protein